MKWEKPELTPLLVLLAAGWIDADEFELKCPDIVAMILARQYIPGQRLESE